MTLSTPNYDVVIAGGGPAGSSAAIHLSLCGARVLLAEQKRFPRAKLCGEFISPECLVHFERLGALDRIALDSARVVKTVFYSRGGSSVEVPSAWFGSGASSALGLSRAAMDERLLARAREVGVQVLEETRAVGLITSGDRVCGIRLKDSAGRSEQRARIVIDATGRSRALAREAEKDGSRKPGRRPGLVAFKAHLQGARGNPAHCEIYFYRGGYGGLSNVEGGLSNLCFIAAARDVRACGSQAERVMHKVVMSNKRAAEALSQASPRGAWLSVALEGFGRRAIVSENGLLAIGDAASFIDPFTGSGMLMALESGELAAGCIERWLKRAGDGQTFYALAADYRARYDERFSGRLRVCSWLRRAAFAPFLAETAIFAFSGSERIRRRLARATRRMPAESAHL